MTSSHRILQVQTGSGLSGGIAGYIRALIHTETFSQFQNSVTIAIGESKSCDQYDPATLFESRESYGPTSFYSYVRNLRNIVRSNNIDLMHAHALRAGFAVAWVSWFTKVPFVYTNHGLRFTQKSGHLRQTLFRLMEAFVCKRANAIVSVRPYDANKLATFGKNYEHKLRTVQTRIAQGDLYETQRSELPVIAGVGSLIDVKRPDRFVDCVKELKNLNVKIDARWLGDGDLRASLAETSRNDELPITWLGHVDSSTVRQELTNADILLLTSEFEVMPLAVLEAYACTTPVICFRFDGVDDFVKDGQTGIIMDTFDGSSAAIAISELLADNVKLGIMSQNARLFFEERFSNPEIMAEQYAAIYNDVLVGWQK
mgnify:CR=1 FL=1